jgi:putative transcriptional regulator
MSEIGKEIRRLREEKNWSQAQLAVYAGSSQPTVNQIESGKRNPSTRTLEKLAEALGAEVGDLFPKAPVPLRLPLEAAGAPELGYLPLTHLLEDWHYLIEETAERHINNAASGIFDTADGAAAYSIAAYTETAQLFGICLERLSPTISNALPESLADLEHGKLTRAMFRLEEAQVAITKAAEAAGVPLEHERSLSEEELAEIEEAAREFESLPELEQRRQMREAWEVVDRLAKEHIANARELAKETRKRSSA